MPDSPRDRNGAALAAPSLLGVSEGDNARALPESAVGGLRRPARYDSASEGPLAGGAPPPAGSPLRRSGSASSLQGESVAGGSPDRPPPGGRASADLARGDSALDTLAAARRAILPGLRRDQEGGLASPPSVFGGGGGGTSGGRPALAHSRTEPPPPRQDSALDTLAAERRGAGAPGRGAPSRGGSAHEDGG